MSNVLQNGTVLLSSPFEVVDELFHQSIIFVTAFCTTETVGFIINKKTTKTLNYFFPEITSIHPIYWGGPVETDNLYFLHNVPHLIENSVNIVDDIYWGGNFETAKILLKTEQITQHNIKFFFGYSGWSAQQLQQEITENAWFYKCEHEIVSVFDDNKNKWQQLLKSRKDENSFWINNTPYPELN